MDEHAKLLCELNESVEFITETAAEGKKNLFITGNFIQMNDPNKNRRIYSEQVLVPVIERYIIEKINNNCAYGQLDHPTGPTITLKEAAIYHKSLVREGNYYVGKAKVATTPMGQIIRNLIEDGANLGISTRGVGTLKQRKDGLMEVQSDFRLATPGDVVSDPSAYNAYVTGLMENVSYWWDVGRDTWVEEQMDVAKQRLKRMTIKEIETSKMMMFEHFLNEVSKL
ncbi:MAG: hypothetical protein P4L79_11075 [Legionella sp.]|uniref:hypothetical protein n=1 Tax=Legionella sp. TaxID=459 RepID=UPI002850AE7A|nr:hypothetical protein [Legionella sp.]